MPTIGKILEVIPHEKFVGDINTSIKSPAQIDVKRNDVNIISWVSDKNIALLDELKHATVICSNAFTQFNDSCNYIICGSPRLAFKMVIENFFVEKEEAYISDRASIHPSVKIGNNTTVGHGVVLEKDCVVGDDCVIGHNTVIKSNTQIGSHVKIGNNNTIGGVGFGYEKDMEGHYSLMPHLGNVVIKDFVEIGNNTCIDRAVMGSTILHEHVKVDNLVHIAHGVVIGKNSLIIANAMIGGSTTIGENVWFAPSASVLNKKAIGDNAVIGLAAVVIKNVADGDTIIGNPGKVLTK